MNRRNVVRLALAAALFGAAIPGAALAQFVDAQAKYWTPKAQVQVQVQSQRFGRFHRDMFEGRWVAQDRNDADFRGEHGNGFGGRGNGFGGGFGGGRMMALPNFLNIDQGRRTISVADGQNNVLQLIVIDNGFHGMQQRGATLLQGDLNGNRLVATGSAGPWGGRQIRQVMTLRNHGNTLVVRTQMQRGNSGRMVEVEKVYDRA
ncbi:MAG TPA: hypothetical protein VE326_07795 [Candidatus Binatia bacterium]|nr:hypothetical protein [Candidatus Binatia bacterium]